MKTAEERALDFFGRWHIGRTDEMVRDVITALKEYARDQRHACAEAVSGALADMEYNRLARTDAHAACLNTAFPGEGG